MCMADWSRRENVLAACEFGEICRTLQVCKKFPRIKCNKCAPVFTSLLKGYMVTECLHGL